MGDWFSIYWAAPIIAWLVAQLLKVIIATWKSENEATQPITFFSSGNMPSSHSAITVALLVVTAGLDGVHSATFGIAFVLTSIVIYDAINVRRAVGEQGEIIRKLAKSALFYTALGHRPSEVLAGACIGFAVAFGLLQTL